MNLDERNRSKPEMCIRRDPTLAADGIKESSDSNKDQTANFARESPGFSRYLGREQTSFSSNENLTNGAENFTDLGARPKIKDTKYCGTHGQQLTREYVSEENDREAVNKGNFMTNRPHNEKNCQNEKEGHNWSLLGKQSNQDIEIRHSYKIEDEAKSQPEESLSSKLHRQSLSRNRKKRQDQMETTADQMKTGGNKRKTSDEPLKEHSLYITLEEQVIQNSNIKEFLKYRMGNPCDLDFTVKGTENIESTATKSMIALHFSCRRKLLQARSLLNKSNRNSVTKICSFDSEKSAKGECEDKTSDKIMVLEDIVTAAERAVRAHDEKIHNIQVRLTDVDEELLKKKGLSLAEFQTVAGQKPALEDKLNELNLQRKEFLKYIQGMKIKIAEVIDKDFEKQVRKIRIAFGAECRRLEAALPMYACREEILKTVKENQVCVVLGETGSGKSTQMVQYLYHGGFVEKGKIVCTQPRKIAAVSLAQRVASEMGTSVGQEIGYRVGMQVKISGLTKVIFVTDHILLNECLRDEHLSQYECIIIDEAHERSVFTDLLLGMLKRCLKTRPELRVIVTSATINPSVFVAYFENVCKCPVLKISGRVFPVEVSYDDNNDDLPFPESYDKKALNKAVKIHKDNPVDAGDILVFLTSPLETEKSCKNFKQLVESDDYDCLQLHGRLTPEEQRIVFRESQKDKRKIVFATNSAETSITIPGIRFVVDTGVVKEMQFDPTKNISSLRVVPISQSSANQRKGRAGRVSIGHCYRLYSEKDFRGMDKIGKPEILRIHLGQGLLKLMEIGADPLSFEFVEPPEKVALTTTVETLEEIGAVENGKITELGRWISKLPVDPRLGALIKRGIDEEVSLETLVIAAYNNQRNIFYRTGSEEEKKQSDMLKVNFCHRHGDIFTALNVYRAWNEVKEGEKGLWCKENSINGKVMKNIRETVKEIMTVLQKECGVKIKYEFSIPGNTEMILLYLVFQTTMQNMCIFLGHEKAGYLTLKRKQRVQIHPSSSLLPLGLQPTWVVFGQLLQTTADFITDVTPISDELIDRAKSDGLLAIDNDSFFAQQVKKAVVIPVGRHVFVTFVGPMHRKRRELEEDISKACNMEAVIIDANKSRGEISIFCRHKFVDKAKSMLSCNINPILESLVCQKMEEPLSTDQKGKSYRALIGLGGQVVDFLQPTDFRSVEVKTKNFCQRDITEENIKDMLSAYGQIEEIRISRKKWQKGLQWGRITFVNKSDAETARHEINNHETYDISLIPITFEAQKSRSNEFTLKLRWCRRPAHDHCFVYLSNPYDLPNILLAGKIRIDNSYFATVHRAKKDSDLMIRGLRSDVMEESIKKGLLHVLGLSEEDQEKRFRKIIIPRSKVGITHPNHIRQQISMRVQEIITEPRVTVDIPDIRENTVMGIAFLKFVNPIDCERVAEDFTNNGFTIYGSKVQVDKEFKTSSFVNKRIFQAIRHDVHRCIQELNSAHSTEIKCRELKSGNFSVEITGPSSRIVALAKAKVDVLIDGDVFECAVTKNLDKIFTASGKKEMQRIEISCGVIISLDQRTKKMAVQGIADNRQKAVKEIHGYLERVDSAQEVYIQLKGKSNPPGMMKSLLTKYGVGVQKLVTENGLVSAKLNLRAQEVIICGFEEGVKKTLDDIQKIKETLLQESTKKDCIDDLPDCPVCLCPVDIADFRRLEYCGHAYCNVCLTNQIENAVQSKEFPIRCACEDCGKPFVVRDFGTQIQQDLIQKRQLIDSSVSAFVTANQGKYRYCSTADCQMVYAVSNESKLFSCPLCLVKVCTMCHKSYHDGITCEMNKFVGKHEDSLQKWLKENPTNRKLCPKCNVGIEKNGGCQRMTCTCGANICWLCMEYFSDSKSCYDHLRREHGTVY